MEDPGKNLNTWEGMVRATGAFPHLSDDELVKKISEVSSTVFVDRLIETGFWLVGGLNLLLNSLFSHDLIKFQALPTPFGIGIFLTGIIFFLYNTFVYNSARKELHTLVLEKERREIDERRADR